MMKQANNNFCKHFINYSIIIGLFKITTETKEPPTSSKAGTTVPVCSLCNRVCLLKA